MTSSGGLHGFTADDIRRSLEYASDKLGLSDGFRSEQSTALTSFLRGHDLFVSLPTGFGKSVIFQAAPLCVDFLRGLHDRPQHDVNTRKAIAIVVMPLKSLVTDQISRATELNIQAADITGGITDEIREGVCSARYSLLFASPESLLGEDGQELFSIQTIREQLCGLFIDESHCVSKWGCSSSDTKAFRGAYGKLGEVRAKIRSVIPCVALTATATKEIRRSVSDNLGLRNYLLVNRSPERSNIKHVVMRSSTKDFDSFSEWMINDVKINGANADRTIIYCQSRRVVSDLYGTFLCLLPGTHHKYVQMYHTNTENDVQEGIIKSLADPAGDVRVLIATIAYGMGVDSKGVYRTVICGHTTDLDDYMQMSGRIGRDNKPSVAITLQYPGDSAGRNTTASMKEFLQGIRCRREVVREVFGNPQSTDTRVTPHDCCDVCARECKCSGDACSAVETPLEKELRKALTNQAQVEELPINIPSPAQVDNLERALQEYRFSLLNEGEDHMYCGADIISGFAEATAEQIVKDCNVQFTYNGFVSRYNFPSRHIAADVWTIVCSSLGRDMTPPTGESVHVCIDAVTDSDESVTVDWSDSEFQEAVIASESDDD